MTRLVVSGVKVDSSTMIDDKTFAEHQFNSVVFATSDTRARTALRAATIDYRAGVDSVDDLSAISKFANLTFHFSEWQRGKSPWPPLWNA